MPHRYLLLYKPYNVICQFSVAQRKDAKGGRQTLADFVNVPNVYPVGRLDHDSEGLVLLTDDGWLQHRLTDPRYDHPKTYWTQVDGSPTEEALAHLRNGVQIWPDFRSRPAPVRLFNEEPVLPPRDPPIRYRAQIPTAWLEIILTEGRNRQVRRMTAAVGFPTLRLVRVAIGELSIAGLEPGQWRELTETERDRLKPFGSAARPPSLKRRVTRRMGMRQDDENTKT